MKKRLITCLIVSLIGLLSSCNNSNSINKNDELARNDMSYMLTRARYDGDRDKMDECTPDIFLSDELKQRYVARIEKKSKAYNGIVGVQNMEYQIVNAGVRKNIFDKLASLYGVDEGLCNEVTKAGYFTYDIVSMNKKGKEIRKKSTNVAFIYEEKWYLIIINEE